MTIGEKIYALRTQAGFSQEEFADIIGVSRQSVSKWELGEALPNTEYVVKICKVLLISTDALLIDKDLPDPILRNDTQKKNESDVDEKNKSSFQTISLVGFILSFFFNIIALIVNSIAVAGQRKDGKVDNFAVAGLAISVVKLYVSIAIVVVYVLISVTAGGGL